MRAKAAERGKGGGKGSGGKGKGSSGKGGERFLGRGSRGSERPALEAPEVDPKKVQEEEEAWKRELEELKARNKRTAQTGPTDLRSVLTARRGGEKRGREEGGEEVPAAKKQEKEAS